MYYVAKIILSYYVGIISWRVVLVSYYVVEKRCCIECSEPTWLRNPVTLAIFNFRLKSLRMERHDCLKDNVIDSCCACYILCRWIVILCCLHIMMSCTSSILCRWIVILCCHRVMMSCACSILCHWVVRLCCIHIMMSCACSILCRWVVILCCHHVMMSCACSILCRWIVRLCCLYIMMSCAFSISCRWVVVLCCQNNIIILCCHHIMTRCASFILCCWVTMLCWMFGTDLTFGTNELPVDKVLFPSQAISLFCYIGLL